jgi:hypothetical protein
LYAHWKEEMGEAQLALGKVVVIKMQFLQYTDTWKKREEHNLPPFLLFMYLL